MSLDLAAVRGVPGMPIVVEMELFKHSRYMNKQMALRQQISSCSFKLAINGGLQGRCRQNVCAMDNLDQDRRRLHTQLTKFIPVLGYLCSGEPHGRSDFGTFRGPRL
eukprot:3580381-Pleurochrysis_carterae.AAC.4